MLPDATIGITHLAADDVWIVHLRGEHDLASQEELVDVLKRIGSTKRIVVDLTETAFIDSTIVGTLMKQARDTTDTGGSLILAVGMDTPPGRVIDMVRLGEIMPIHSSVAAALGGLDVSEPVPSRPGEQTTEVGTGTP